MVHTKYIRYGPHGLKKKIVLKINPILSQWKLVTNLDPRAWLAAFV